MLHAGSHTGFAASAFVAIDHEVSVLYLHGVKFAALYTCPESETSVFTFTLDCSFCLCFVTTRAFREALGGKGNTEMKEPRTITVNASGTAKAVPDKAEISFGVTTQAKTPDAAQQENAETIDKVIAHLKERGIEEKSIQTSGYNLYPEYDYNGNTPKITGYQVRTTLTVTDQDIDDAGDIVSECVKLGINDVDNFRFYASTYDEAYEEALVSAVAAANKKAEVLAKSADGELGRVLSLNEGYQNTTYRYAKANYAMAEAAAMDTGAGFGMSVMPGEAEITAQVTVTDELN